MYLQHPINKDTKILSYARYSTEEQRSQSIDDQHQQNVAFLEEQGVDTSSVDRLQDEGISGEIRSRSGINKVLAGIAALLWQLIIVEDSSRLFRGVAPCIDLVGRAVDAGIRIICIGDRVDTADEDWQSRLEDAQRHHGHDNFKTRYRIKRALDGLWRMGAAIGLLNPGYERYQVNPENPKAPKFDRVIERFKPNIKRVYEMVATGHSTWEAAEYLTQECLPKTSNSSKPEWTRKNVISLIRKPIYRGEESYRVTVAKKIHSTGKTKCEENPNPDKVLWRPMPHLQIVEDLLWHQANQKLNELSTVKPKHGRESLLYGIPRDSRGPLSTIFECGICGRPMYMEGRNEGGYRCSGVKQRQCWNKATSIRDLTHQRIGAAMSQEILSACSDQIDSLLEYAESRMTCSAEIEAELKKLNRQIAEVKKKENKLLELFLEDMEPTDTVKEKLSQLQSDKKTIQLSEQQLQARKSLAVAVPTREQLFEKLQEASEQISLNQNQTTPLLRQLLVAPIRAIPCQQFGSSKVVLRAEFTIQLIHLLPDELRLLLSDEDLTSTESELFQKTICVDLFEPSMAPKYAMQALEIYESNTTRRPTLVEIGEKLGISKRSTHLALKLGHKMHEAGLTDPFIPLEECPENASRWRISRAG
ncbi:recombinase family protein [Rubinisphaera italica]|uniref:Resolvase/invertase-type recombinase catalytic domain-containing protein n=1 Tax=Rubinisphaera italica TaxID=2527969 RepID=A0A5C5XAA3_9PLAN|nr:recombinase family protein [Rubinisphaera italica]TWT59724.1 hypothetical protein Pan54_04340 [Rubinisphaera italica]